MHIGKFYGKSRFEILKSFARGGMGELYLAQDHKTQEKVVLKTVASVSVGKERDVLLKRFSAEASAMRRMRHPNIVKTVGSFLDDNPSFIAMEYLRGWSNLEKALERRALLSPSSIKEIAAGVLRALVCIHSLSGRVHRDIAPQNVMILGAGSELKVKVIDFGLISGDRHTENLTHTDLYVGRYQYFAPELLVADSKPKPNQAHDLFALGLTLWVSAHGEHPYIKDGGELVSYVRFYMGARNVQHDLLPKIRSDIQGGLKDLLLGLLHCDPKLRFASALRALRVLENGDGKGALPPEHGQNHALLVETLRSEKESDGASSNGERGWTFFYP